MLVQESKSKSRNNSKNNAINSSWDVQEVNPNLYLRDNIKGSKNHVNINSKSNIAQFTIKKQLSIELLKEILKNPSNSNEENEFWQNLIDKIEQKRYYYCYGGVEGENSGIIRFFEQSERIIERPLLIVLPDMLDYDVELYKIGKTCSGLKKRYAIIKRGGFFSSKKPLSQMTEADNKKIKDKTMYLPGSKVIMETRDDPNRTKSEWSNKNKIYRLRINFSLEKFEKNPKHKESSFYLYFDDEKKMKEVEIMLFGFSLTEKNRNAIKKHLADIDTDLTQGNLFYIIMKILSVKSKIKKRKIAFSKLNNTINGQMFGKLNIGTKLLKRLSLQRKETMRLNFLKKNSQPQIEAEPVFKAKPPKVVKLFEKQYSDNMPIISNVSPVYGSKSNKKNKKSLNDLIKKYKSLKDEIPTEIIDENNIELSDEGVCFNIPNGVYIMMILILIILG